MRTDDPRPVEQLKIEGSDGAVGECCSLLQRYPIALVTPNYHPSIGGVQRVVERLAQHLTHLGIPVEVITTDPTGSHAALEEQDGVLVRRFPTLGNTSVYHLSPSLIWWLWKHVRHYSLIHVHSYHSPLAVAAAAVSRRKEVPYLLSTYFHGTGHSSFRRSLHILYRIPARWAMRHAAKIICISEAERALVEAQCGSGLPIIVVPVGVDLERILSAQTLPQSQGRVTLLTAGRLEHYKRTILAVEALALLPPQYHLVVIGKGLALPSLRDAVEKHGLTGRVTFLGHVSDDELNLWYRTADVFISMSSHESFGMTLLEAAVGGASVVASDIPAHVEVGRYLPDGKVAFVDRSGSTSDLAAAIRAARPRQQVSSTELVKVPTWENMADSVWTCYRRILEDGAAIGSAELD
jgi:glycosyltransferase involved in cell wall biosynthesis